MKIIYKNKNELKTVPWSGGTTTELAVWPEGASYRGLDFGFRISTSTVEQETSVFTSLPGVRRIIMVLDGAMDLEHEGYHKVRLEKFMTDQFEGGWKTISHGRCRDFNLMLRNGMSGEMQGMTIRSSSVQLVASEFTGLYVIKGCISFFGKEKEVCEGDFILFMNEDKDEKITFNIVKPAEVVLVKIKKSFL